MNKRSIFIIVFLFFCFILNAQIDSLNKKKFNRFFVSSSVLYAGTMTGLYFSWYQQHNTSNFHFFNDSKEWLQMDKAGHIYTAFHIQKYSYLKLSNSGLTNSKALWLSAGISSMYMTTIEVFDGFSDGWGASVTDILANTGGVTLFSLQNILWREQKITLKFSYHNSSFAHYRPNLLGNTWYEKPLKDYNGQTYWLNANIAAILKVDFVPKWIDLSLGYGASGMLGGHNNPSMNDMGVVLPEFNRIRQYYISIDINPDKMKVNNKFLRYSIQVFKYIKLPFPAIQIQEGIWYVKPLYF